MPLKRKAGNDALHVMDAHLRGRDWLVGEGITLADICLFAYTHVAGDADFPLKDYRHVAEWLERVKKQPNYVAMSA